MTVAVADRIKARLIDAFKDTTSLAIDVSEATDIDVSALQMLLAARKMADARGTTMTVLRDDRLLRELDRCGIPANAICHAAQP